MTGELRSRWDRASRAYDRVVGADALRFAAARKRLLANLRGRSMLVAIGTGRDVPDLPTDLWLIGVDISHEMLARAGRAGRSYEGSLHLLQSDVERLPFAGSSFDTVATSCTLCSVRDPIAALREIRRVLRSDGRLLLFEHVRSRIPPIALMQDLVTPVTRRIGPAMNRDTLGNVQRAGFRIVGEENVYLDIVKAAVAVAGS